MIYIIQYGASGITAKLPAIHSGSRKMRRSAPFTARLLGDRAVGMAVVGELLLAAYAGGENHAYFKNNRNQGSFR
jgi:hypothetical protein